MFWYLIKGSKENNEMPAEQTEWTLANKLIHGPQNKRPNNLFLICPYLPSLSVSSHVAEFLFVFLP